MEMRGLDPFWDEWGNQGQVRKTEAKSKEGPALKRRGCRILIPSRLTPGPPGDGALGMAHRRGKDPVPRLRRSGGWLWWLCSDTQPRRAGLTSAAPAALGGLDAYRPAAAWLLRRKSVRPPSATAGTRGGRGFCSHTLAGMAELQAFWSTVKRNAVVSPNRIQPFNASRAPINSQRGARCRLAWP